MKKGLYTQRREDFYDIQTKSLNPLRSWFHTTRHRIVGNLVSDNYKKGMKVVDLACGNCVWNAKKIPVIGVDISKKLMEHAFKNGRISEAIVSDVHTVKLADGYADIVVATEMLEHMPSYEKVVYEMARILKKGGKLILTVPYDTFFSMWKPLFKVQCILQGYVFGDDYYKHECGHINHFSPKAIRNVLEKNGFKILKQFTNYRFTIFTLAEKK